MNYSIFNISEIIAAKTLLQGKDYSIEYLLTDSRKLLFPEKSLFFALPGIGRNGNAFIKSLYKSGVRNFVVDEHSNIDEIIELKECNLLTVPNVLDALQKLAVHHRHKFSFPVIGITGSNGKTIVKEWLHQILSDDFNIVRSPKSFNSQIGVPLSVWRINEDHDLGVFESGISTTGEMIRLQKIIDPTIGIVTSIGSAHAEGFTSKEEKISEKLLLFSNSEKLIFCADDEKLLEGIRQFQQEINPSLHLFSWGYNKDADVVIDKLEKKDRSTIVHCVFQHKRFQFYIPFTDEASIQNAITCTCILIVLNFSTEDITEKIGYIKPLEMRMELKQGINNCSIINDTYSADMQSLSVSLDFLQQQNQHLKKTIILSDVLQSNQNSEELYTKIAEVLKGRSIQTFIGIGNEISAEANIFTGFAQTYFYPSTEAFLQNINAHQFKDETILLKGARVFKFERISHLLEEKVHDTRLEVNLNALRHNLNIYKQMLLPNVKMMVMVKAFSYGSGSFEVANLLQHAGIHYLAVAYADEGIELRKAGITAPIMVMNAETSGFENIVKYNLQPEIFSFSMLQNFKNFLRQKNAQHYPVHIKIDTGMHRLGFEPKDIDELVNVLTGDDLFQIESVFSHLAAGGEAAHDQFTTEQANLFKEACKKLEVVSETPFLKHIANSSAISRHPHLQMDMVRLGIGIYGVDSDTSIQHKLQHVTTLKTTVSQIKHVKKGESIGYSRKAIAETDLQIATVRIGYADGYPRMLSNGKGKMLINGFTVPVIGNICMDMTMLNITGLDVQEADEVIVFGEEPGVKELANWADTIPYEILTNISQRVKRVYFEE